MAVSVGWGYTWGHAQDAGLPTGRLYERLKSRGDAFNVSNVLQRALEEALSELDWQEALGVAIRGYEAKHGRITAKDIAAQQAADRAAARRSRPPRGRGKNRAA